MNRLILSENAAYGNSVELSNAIGCPVVFNKKDPKGMWKIALNASYGYKNIELNNVDEIIIVGAVSIKTLQKQIKGFDYIIKNTKTKIILTDTYYLLRSAQCNELYDRLGLIVYCMPALIKYRKGLPTIPYYQPFDLGNYPIKKNKELTVCHTPYHLSKLETKGSFYICETLRSLPIGLRFDFVMNKSWKETLEIRSRSHITIDAIVERGNYLNGVGKSGLEALWLNSAVITTGEAIEFEQFNTPPVLYTTIGNFKSDLYELITDESRRNKQIKEQRIWAEKYTSYKFVADHVTTS